MIGFPDRSIRTLVVICFTAIAGSACVQPQRVALPSPFPLTYGGTTVPAAGAIVGFELADGLRGQELERVETVGASVGIGLGDRVSVGFAGYEGHEDFDPVGSIARVGIRVGDLLGGVFKRPTSTAIQLARVVNHRVSLPLQDDSLVTWDVAIPTEVLLVDKGTGRAGLYLGPRFTRGRISDAVTPADSMTRVYLGGLAGAHLQYKFLHLFGEVTVLHVPGGEFRGAATGGRITVMPAIGVTALIGRAHKWGKR